MNFDEIYDRVATRSSKWTLMEAEFGVAGDDLLPMWIADMDFKAPAFLTDAARAVADSGDFGYHTHTGSYRDAVCWWAQARHGWTIEPAWTLWPKRRRSRSTMRTGVWTCTTWPAPSVGKSH